MRNINKKKIICLMFACIILILSILGSLYTVKKVEREELGYEVLAEAKMQDLSSRIAQYKKELGIPKNEVIYWDAEKTREDYARGYLIGDEFTEITTTIGEIGAKRTAASSRSAALMVHILYENGIRPNDTIAAQMTGSFLGYDLALLSACEVMNIKLVYTISFGSSMYGANQPMLTFPDMVIKLIEDGAINNEPLAISVGGDFDMGEEMEPTIRDEVKNRLMQSKYEFISIRDFKKNIDYRLSMYNQYDFDFFIAVGGNVVSLGIGDTENKKGLLQIYKEQGKKTMQIVNIKKLVSDYGMDFDMPTMVQTKDDIYYKKNYNIYISIVGILLSVIVILYGSDKINGAFNIKSKL